MQVKELTLKHLPESLYNTIKTVNELITAFAYDELKKYPKVDKKIVDKFCKLPEKKTNVSSVMVYKNKNTYSCMIQITNHIDTNETNRDFHELLKEVFIKMKKHVKKFNLTIKSEFGDKGEFEGFDVWTNHKMAKLIWDENDVDIKEMKESYIISSFELNKLPIGLQNNINETFNKINDYFDKFKNKYPIFENVIIENPSMIMIDKHDDIYEGVIQLTHTDVDDTILEKTHLAYNNIYNAMQSFNEHNPCKELILENNEFHIILDNEYTKKIYEYLSKINFNEKNEIKNDIKSNPSLTKAKELLSSITRDVINNKGSVNKHTLQLYSDIISKQLLPSMKVPFKKFNLLTHKDDNRLEFVLPSKDKDRLIRIIEGKETLNGLTHSDPQITLYVPEKLFKDFKNDNDMYNFIHKAIKYYDNNVNVYGDKMISLFMKHKSEVKKLYNNKNISTVIKGCIDYLFSFNYSYNMNFKKDKNEIKKIFDFITNFNNKDDIFKLINFLHELKILKDVNNLKYQLNKYYSTNFKNDIKMFKEQWEDSHIDYEYKKGNNDQLKYVIEKFGVKKLKKIPIDLIAYITIETECIKNSNDKMMLASYTLGKIELVEWYIELLEVGSKRYSVPHNKPYLEKIRTQLLECYKNIMKVKIENKKEPEWKMPPEYEG